MSKNIAVILFFIFSGINIWASAGMGRIDINGRFSKVELKPLESSGHKIQFGTWLKPEDVKRYLTVNLKGDSTKWSEGKISFIPLADGRISISLLGPYIRGKKPGAKPVGVYYDEIKINGKLVKNGDFEKKLTRWTLGKSKVNIPARIVTDKNIVKFGKRCILAWHNATARTVIKVKKGEKVEISFMFRPAGEIASQKNKE